MAKATAVDKYSNLILATATESAANTLTFQELPQITTLLEKKAFLINKVIYGYDHGEIAGTGDAITFGLSLSNRWTDASIDEPTVIDFHRMKINYFGAAANAVPFVEPIEHDFSTLPGGGVLIPTRPMYLYIKGTSLANPTSVVVRIYFTIVELNPQDYWDLVESLQAYS